MPKTEDRRMKSVTMDRIEKAFRKVDRSNFVPEGLESQAVFDMPLPIGFGQTISQPTTVEMMLRWLEPESGDKVMDVGSGSGWTTALLANIVGPKGSVYAVERIAQLMEFGRDNCARLGLDNVHFLLSGKIYGLPQYAPFDRILVSASATKLPEELIDQLVDGGKMVIPVGSDVLEITKHGSDYEVETHPGFVFVNLV